MTRTRLRHGPRLPAGRRRRARPRGLGRQPLGLAFVAPYVVFLVAVFAYPLGFAVWMSLPRLLLHRAGRDVDRPFVGLDNYAAVLSDPDVPRSFLNIGVFLVINVPLTVVLSLVLATALNAAVPVRAFFRVAYYVPYVTASVAVVAVWLYLFSTDGLVNQRARRPRARPVVAGQLRRWRCRSSRSSSPGSSSASSSCSTWPRCRTCPRSCTSRPRSTARAGGSILGRHGARRTPGDHPRGRSWPPSPAPTCSPSRTCSPAAAGPNGASASPVLVMYQRGIEQGHPDVAAAIGVVLVAGGAASSRSSTAGSSRGMT